MTDTQVNSTTITVEVVYGLPEKQKLIKLQSGRTIMENYLLAQKMYQILVEPVK